MKMISRCAVSLATLAGLFCLSAHAEEVVIDEASISSQGKNIYHFLRRGADTPLSGADAERIKKGFLSDTKVDDGERALIDALLAGKAIRLKPQYSTGSEYVFSRELSAEASAVLNSIESYTVDDPIYQLWLEATPESINTLLTMFEAGGEQRQKVYDMLRGRLETIWATSRYQDDYKDMANELLRWANRCSNAATGQYRPCRSMVYTVISDYDGAGLGGPDTTGGIPDHLYSQFKPNDD